MEESCTTLAVGCGTVGGAVASKHHRSAVQIQVLANCIYFLETTLTKKLMDSGCGTMVQRLLLTPPIAYSKSHPQNSTLRFASKKWNKNIYRLKYKIIFTADAVVISFALFNIFIKTNERTNEWCGTESRIRIPRQPKFFWLVVTSYIYFIFAVLTWLKRLSQKFDFSKPINIIHGFFSLKLFWWYCLDYYNYYFIDLMDIDSKQMNHA